MDKYFFLKRTGVNEVKGLKVTVVGSDLTNMKLTVFTQAHHQLKKGLPMKVIAEGSIEDVFSHLPKSLIDEEGKFEIIEDNYGTQTKLTIKPIRIKQGKFEFAFAALECWQDDKFDLIDCDKLQRYLKQPKKVAEKPKTNKHKRKQPYFVPSHLLDMVEERFNY